MAIFITFRLLSGLAKKSPNLLATKTVFPKKFQVHVLRSEIYVCLSEFVAVRCFHTLHQ